MIALEKARHYLEQLGLNQAAAVLDSRLEAEAARPSLDFAGRVGQFPTGASG